MPGAQSDTARKPLPRFSLFAVQEALLAMFSSFISAIQGDTAHDSDGESEAQKPDGPGTSDWAASLSGFASGLAKSVQERTAEIAESVTKTDWKSELSVFTSEVKKDAEIVGKVSCAQVVLGSFVLVLVSHTHVFQEVVHAAAPPGPARPDDTLSRVTLDEV